MTRYLLDTDTFSQYLRGDEVVTHAVARHLTDVLLIPIITVEELWSGWQAVIARARTAEQLGVAYQRLTDTLNALHGWEVVSFTGAASRRYAELKRQKLNVGANDLKIAAIALELAAVVVTHNGRDFTRIPGVRVEDWVAR